MAWEWGPLGLRVTPLISHAPAETSQPPAGLQVSRAGRGQRTWTLSGQGAAHCSGTSPAWPHLEAGCPVGWLTVSLRSCGPGVGGGVGGEGLQQPQEKVCISSVAASLLALRPQLAVGTWWPVDLESLECVLCDAYPCPAPHTRLLRAQTGFASGLLSFLRVFPWQGQEAGRKASCSPGSLTCSPGPPGRARACCWGGVSCQFPSGAGGGTQLRGEGDHTLLCPQCLSS